MLDGVPNYRISVDFEGVIYHEFTVARARTWILPCLLYLSKLISP